LHNLSPYLYSTYFHHLKKAFLQVDAFYEEIVAGKRQPVRSAQVRRRWIPVVLSVRLPQNFRAAKAFSILSGPAVEIYADLPIINHPIGGFACFKETWLYARKTVRVLQNVVS
jgi:hypothetical protein